MGLVVLIVLVLLLVGALPRYDYSREWGPAPAGGVGLLIVVVLLLILLGHVPVGW